MPVRQIKVEGVGAVRLYKRRGVKRIRLSIDHDSRVKVVLPYWVPYRFANNFIEQKRAWIVANTKPVAVLEHGMLIGQSHRLAYEAGRSSKTTSRVSKTHVIVFLPKGAKYDAEPVQAAAKKACVRALKKQALELLPQRTEQLARQHGFEFKSVKVKRLRSRWGSCSQQKDIVLNCFLVQLPQEFIDYVILHELMHTRVLAHGKTFWLELSEYVPELADIRKSMRTFQPTIQPSTPYEQSKYGSTVQA